MPSMSRRIFSVLTGAVCALGGGIAAAQDYPTKPVRLVVPNSPGLTADTLARLMMPEMSRTLGQTIVVENKPGADATIGLEFVARQMPADGYTVVIISNSTLATLPLTAKGLRFDPLKDLAPVIGVAEGRNIFGSSTKLPWKTFGELVAHAKANPGKLNYGSSATTTRLQTESLLRDAGIEVVHVPFSSGGPHMTALVAADIDMSFTVEGLAVNFGDKFRTLAVTGTQHSKIFPDAPTFAELGHPNIRGQTHALFVRAGTARGVIDRLNAAASKAQQHPEARAGIAKLRQEFTGHAPDVVAKQLADEARIFAEVAKKIGLKSD